MFITRKRYEESIKEAVYKAMDERDRYEALSNRIQRVEEQHWKDHEQVMKILSNSGLIKPDEPHNAAEVTGLA